MHIRLKKYTLLITAFVVALTLALGACGRPDGNPGSTTGTTVNPDSQDELMTRETRLIGILRGVDQPFDNVFITGTNLDVTFDKYIGTKTSKQIMFDIRFDNVLYYVRMETPDGEVKEMSGSLSPGAIDLYFNADFESTPDNAGIKAVISIKNTGGRKIKCKVEDVAGGRIIINDRDNHLITGTSERENLTIEKISGGAS